MKRVLAFGSLAIVALCGAAFAQSVAVGSAVVAVNDVTGKVEVETRRIGEGSFVYRNETVSTARDSRARLALQDNTNISLGPNAAVTLDQFVALPTGGAGAVVVNATRGVLRFVSGNSGSQTYQIKTPHATIGVRGTVFDLEVSAAGTRAQLKDGAIDACPNGGACIPVNRPGDIISISAGGGVSGPAPGPTATLFDPFCSGGSICQVTTAFGGTGADRDGRGASPEGSSSSQSSSNSTAP